MAELKFEKDLERLEGIVQALEDGGLPLDDALKRFEEGIRLAKRCERALQDAEKKIELLTKNADGEFEAQPFGNAEAENADEPVAKKTSARKKSATHEAKPDEGEDDEDGGLLF